MYLEKAEEEDILLTYPHFYIGWYYATVFMWDTDT